MAIIYFNGTMEDEQARGPVMDNGVVQAFAIKKSDPTNMIYLGGHRVDDAPSYNISEGKVGMEYKFKNGRNRVVETTLSNDYVKSVTFNLMLPQKAISVTDLVYQSQEVCDYDLVFLPRNCESGCNEWFWLGEELVLGVKQIQGSIIGYDDNEGPITMMRTAKITDNLQSYYGLQQSAYDTATNGLYAVLIVDDDSQCATCGCPYQTIVRGGAGTALAEPDLEYTDDGGETWTTIDTSAITADDIITSIAYIGGNLIVGTSDVHGATGTTGGIYYAAGVGSAMVAATLDVATLGIQSLVVVGNVVYAFGTGGEVYKSCDNGLTWTKNLLSPIVGTVLDAAYDNVLNKIFIAAASAEAWTFDGVSFEQINADFSPTAATDLESVAVLRSGGGVTFGGADGMVYESWDFVGAGDGTWKTSALGTGVVGAIAGDGTGYRTIIGHDTDVVRRSVLTEQYFEVFTNNLTGVITDIAVGESLADEGSNFFLLVTDAGEMVSVAKCVMCLETDC